MHSRSLSGGARLLRRWRAYSDIRRVHPWRSAMSYLAFPLYAVCIVAMLFLWWIGSKLSPMGEFAERLANRYGDWYQSGREFELRRRAWLAAQNPAAK